VQSAEAGLPSEDAVDRILLHELDDSGWLGDGYAVAVDDVTGALSTGLAARNGGGTVGRCHDSLIAERAVTEQLSRLGVDVPAGHLGPDTFRHAELVLLRLPKSLAALDELAEAIARQAAPTVRILAGGRIKHLTRGMNDVLARHFERVSASLGRQKCRVLRASEPIRDTASTQPATRRHDDLGLTVCAYGGAFAGSSIDLGTRFLTSFADRLAPGVQTIVDLGCGTGVLAVAAARAQPDAPVVAIDESWAAVRSARATATVNALADRITVEQSDGLPGVPDGTVGLVLCNPPFHRGTARESATAFGMIDEAARVLAPGGELWLVFNSHLPYLPAVRRVVGRTTVAGQNPRFTVTRSVRR
jgi:16S rRNA (guanine1207-N2)-methyltransferase